MNKKLSTINKTTSEKRKKLSTYIIAILCIIGGIFMLLSPEKSTASIIYNIGLIMLVIGIFKIVSALFNKNNFLLPGNYFFSGALNCVFGIILMSNTTRLVKTLSIVIGAWFLINSIMNLGMLLNYRKLNNTIDIRILTENILKLILGIIIMTTPIIFVIFTGTFLGIILILLGIIIVYNETKNKKVYSIKIKS